jgi:diacylglycerol kinase family enzyme
MTAAQALTQVRPAAALPARRPRLRSLSPHLLLVANANASGLVRSPELLEGAQSLIRTFGARVETTLTATTDELAAVLAGAERRVALLGGDGSLHAAANTPGPKPELALIPAGRANNVATSLGVPTDLPGAARLAVAGQATPLDLIGARTPARRHLAVEGISVGFHAVARAGYNGRNSADLVAGARAAVRALARFRPLAVGIEVDGSFEVQRIGQLFVANMPLYGFGLRVAPDADPSDGRLELVTIETGGRASLLALLPHLRKGTHVGRPGVQVRTARRVRIATGGRSPIIADTTNLGSGTVELTVERAALAVVGGAR